MWQSARGAEVTVAKRPRGGSDAAGVPARGKRDAAAELERGRAAGRAGSRGARGAGRGRDLPAGDPRDTGAAGGAAGPGARLQLLLQLLPDPRRLLRCGHLLQGQCHPAGRGGGAVGAPGPAWGGWCRGLLRGPGGLYAPGAEGAGQRGARGDHPPSHTHVGAAGDHPDGHQRVLPPGRPPAPRACRLPGSLLPPAAGPGGGTPDRCHVVILGDINTSHRPIDHCEPGDPETFREHPGRRWLDGFLWPPDGQGLFVDTFRLLHPSQPYAFTCWRIDTGARLTNHGTRLDYILADRALALAELRDARILPEVPGSDHCPVLAELAATFLPAPRCPPLCTRHMPEFAGTQQKLSRFLVRVERGLGDAGAGGMSQGAKVGRAGAVRRGRHPRSGQGNLLSYFRVAQGRLGPGMDQATAGQGGQEPAQNALGCRTQEPAQNALGCRTQEPAQNALGCRTQEPAQNALGCRTQEPAHNALGQNGQEPAQDAPGQGGEEPAQDAPGPSDTVGHKEWVRSPLEEVAGAVGQTAGAQPSSLARWRAVLPGPAPPPHCPTHSEPCALRTVRKAGPNRGRRFYVCARPPGRPDDPRARCDFFRWASKGCP